MLIALAAISSIGMTFARDEQGAHYQEKNKKRFEFTGGITLDGKAVHKNEYQDLQCKESFESYDAMCECMSGKACRLDTKVDVNAHFTWLTKKPNPVQPVPQDLYP